MKNNDNDMDSFMDSFKENQLLEYIQTTERFKNFVKAFVNIGELVTSLYDPLKHARLLELNGQTINLTDPKYEFLKEWLEKNHTQDNILYYWNYTIDQNDTNKITLPNTYNDDIGGQQVRYFLKY